MLSVMGHTMGLTSGSTLLAAKMRAVCLRRRPECSTNYMADITGNVHIEHCREDPGCGGAATVLHCAVAVFPAY